MEETGIMKKLRDTWTGQGLDDSGSASSAAGIEEADALGYDNVLFPFLILLFGSAVAVVMAVVEKFYLGYYSRTNTNVVTLSPK